MNTHTKSIIEKMRANPITKGREIGVVSVMCKGAEVDEGADDTQKNDLVAIITTDRMDLDDEIIEQGALNFSYLESNQSVFVDHDYDTLSKTAGFLRGPLGKWPSTKEHHGWKARIRLYTNPAGEAIKLMVRESGSMGVSIGFFPTDRGPLTAEEKTKYTKNGKTPSSIVRAADVFEFSFTALPCNVECQAAYETLKTLVHDGLIDRKTATMFGYEPKKKTLVYLTPHGLERV